MRFLLVDRLEPAETEILGVKLAAMSEDYFEWHFPGRPIVPGMLILEGAVQTAGWWIAAQSEFASWFLLDRVVDARYYAFGVPGHRIEMQVRPSGEPEDGRARFEVDCTVDGARSARLEFEGVRVPLAPLMDPDAAQQMYAQLCAHGGKA